MAIADYVAVMPEQTDAALERLCEAVEHARVGLDAVLERAGHLRAERAKGRPYSEIAVEEPRPLLVEVLTDVLDELSAAGAGFRRSEARVLHSEGLSQETIAGLFGVTRQRVSVLLQDR